MATEYTISMSELIKDNCYEILYMPADEGALSVSSPDINRPGLIFTGYEEFFDETRIQIIGKTEMGYLNSLDDETRRKSIENFMSKKPVAVVITRNLEPVVPFMELAQQYEIPVLRTTDTTCGNMASLISYLGVNLAQRITRHGVLVEVAGEGVLILGNSGVGKSETAVELIKRGHRLIADDAVEIRKVSSKTLVGQSPGNIRHFIEMRGIGIINARQIFGMGAVKLTEKIDMVIIMEQWDPTKVYDRMGMNNDYLNIMGVHVPAMVIPVKPGRNLAIIIEVAAMNNRQKKMGYNAARELMNSLGMEDFESESHEIEFWH
ncbi:MAG TPA: HPr(Ser) kinase/phosphatase [Clostridiales bacterium]|jgi:HPr kinase/phosphorylase|nr:HPr(Ser) kinase/phosphatase [Clostridiales bacterium]